jgi:N utilization substance protein B
MSRRSRAREVALQLLFQHDQNKVAVNRTVIERFAADRLGDPESAAFCLELLDGVNKHRPELDDLIAATAENWKLHRMMPVDRNVLRLGAFELLYAADRSPVAVVLNEAIELARRFGTADSPGFVNGLLDKIARMRNGELGTRNAEPASVEPSPVPADPA